MGDGAQLLERKKKGEVMRFGRVGLELEGSEVGLMLVSLYLLK